MPHYFAVFPIPAEHVADVRFHPQYSFPPFDVGEVGLMGPPGRREIGHGKLAEWQVSDNILRNSFMVSL